jgi:hypothetical protein
MSIRLVLIAVALWLAAGCDKEIKEARLDRPAGQGEALVALPCPASPAAR